MIIITPEPLAQLLDYILRLYGPFIEAEQKLSATCADKSYAQINLSGKTAICSVGFMPPKLPEFPNGAVALYLPENVYDLIPRNILYTLSQLCSDPLSSKIGKLPDEPSEVLTLLHRTAHSPNATVFELEKDAPHFHKVLGSRETILDFIAALRNPQQIARWQEQWRNRLYAIRPNAQITSRHEITPDTLLSPTDATRLRSVTGASLANYETCMAQLRLAFPDVRQALREKLHNGSNALIAAFFIEVIELTLRPLMKQFLGIKFEKFLFAIIQLFVTAIILDISLPAFALSALITILNYVMSLLPKPLNYIFDVIIAVTTPIIFVLLMLPNVPQLASTGFAIYVGKKLANCVFNLLGGGARNFSSPHAKTG